MTEVEWITATDPQEMLEFLQEGGKASERKLRLFAVACCRRIWHLITLEAIRAAVGVAERHADGEAGDVKLSLARAAAVAASTPRVHDHASFLTWDASQVVVSAASTFVGQETPEATAAWAYRAAAEAAQSHQAGRAEDEAQADLLRDIFGPLPFRPVTLPPSARKWDDGTIAKLAEAAYQERALPSGELDRERLAVLADALEEVGADIALMEHLRGPGPHVRGCWLVDLLTRREASP